MSGITRCALPLVAILRGLTLAEAEPVGRTLLDAGWRLLEVPLNRPQALDCIAALCAMAPADAWVGAGTVLSTADVDNVHAAGGRLIVAPNCDADVIRRARELGLAVAPGVATPTEAFNALRWGADALKIFPADMVGAAGLKAFKSVLPPDTALWPVGGVSPGQIAAWVAAGANGFGIGSQLYQPGMAIDELGRRVQAFSSAWHAAVHAAPRAN